MKPKSKVFKLKFEIKLNEVTKTVKMLSDMGCDIKNVRVNSKGLITISYETK